MSAHRSDPHREAGLATLTARERETLHLIVRGHGAKSAASELGLSVHTINERLRAARRKLGTTSSREAARMLFEKEARDNKIDGDRFSGEASRARSENNRRLGRINAWLTGGLIMSMMAAAALLLTPLATGGSDAPDAEAATYQAAVEQAARAWLAKVDARDWQASYAATAASFRQANTLALWSDTANRVQGDLGATLSRELLAVDDVPSPQGITIVKYRTDFANRKGALETLSLVRESGTWKVAGIYVQ